MIHQAGFAINQLVGAAPYYSALLTFAFLGVLLVVDREAQTYYIETSSTHDRPSLRLALAVADLLGLELMDEAESPAQAMPNGHIRLYLASIDGY